MGGINKRGVLLGVTGGIATGKSTVARLLEEKGAPLVDFDELSRAVVEPGKEAWQEIVSFFGEEVLLPDRTLNRRKVSEIVFRDPAKRKRLESITHPRIHEEFRARVSAITSRDPGAIIQAAIPLLIETNLQSLFDKILLVYTPREVQIRRLMDRDRIPEGMALSILAAQMPIEEKKAYADYIVDNSGPLEETASQVDEVWRDLLEYQGTRKEGGS